MRPPRRFIVTDAVFSMDGDAADLTALCALADRYDAILVVDEAHATGVLGPTGAGLCELQNVSQRVDIVVSTASKALGSMGGIVTAKQVVIDTLINRARSFIYTTAAPPAQAASISAALDVVADEPHLRHRLHEIIRYVRSRLRLSDADTQGNAPETSADDKTPSTSPTAPAPEGRLRLRENGDTREPVLTPIIPIITGSATSALALSSALEDAGYFAPAIRPPTVAPGSSRVRLALRADLTDAHVEGLVDVLRKWRP